MDLGPHSAFIWASYGIVTLALGALIAWLLIDGRAQERALTELEAEAGRQRGDRRGQG